MSGPFDAHDPIDPDIEPADFETAHFDTAQVETAQVETAQVEAADGEPPGPGSATLPRFSVHIAVSVFAGGLAGGLARYLIGRAWPAPLRGFPWNTFVVNVTGSFALGVLVVAVEVLGYRARLGPVRHIRAARYLRPALGTGFLGAFTTFSALALSTDQLMAHSHVGLGLAYLVASVVAGLLAAFGGLGSGRLLSQRWTRTPTVVAR